MESGQSGAIVTWWKDGVSERDVQKNSVVRKNKRSVNWSSPGVSGVHVIMDYRLEKNVGRTIALKRRYKSATPMSGVSGESVKKESESGIVVHGNLGVRLKSKGVDQV